MVAAARGTSKRVTQKGIVPVARQVITYFLMTLVAITTVGPFIVMLSASLTKNLAFITLQMKLIPNPIVLENFDTLFKKTMVLRWLLNSVYTTGVATIGAVLTSSIAGYAFARGDFLGKEIIFTAFLGILMMPATASIVPQFIVLARMGLINTYTALIGPAFASIFGTFMLRQHYLSIPQDYDDAAYIDGANIYQIYWKVLLPQITPALATLAVLRFMGHWNSFLYPMIMTSKNELRTLTVGLGTVYTRGTNAGLDMAGAVVAFLPTFLIFILGQKYIIEGVALSGVKG